MNTVKTIIVGFGFSCIPLIRELDLSKDEYLIISDPLPGSIWPKLNENNMLDFDLVTSYYTSFYTFDIVNNVDTEGDRYPLAKEFYDYQVKYRERYKDQIIGDHVKRIENYEDHSLVYTESGEVYKTTFLVFSTGFNRKINKSLYDFDYSVKNKTIVFDSLGDSSNLMISKLVANNKIICVSNGIWVLDKIFSNGTLTGTLDQFEVHNFALKFKGLYRLFVLGSSIFINNFTYTPKDGFFRKCYTLLGKILTPSLFWFTHPHIARHIEVTRKRWKKCIAIPNGMTAMKYWPIDTYEKKFGNNLEEAIKEGHLLNDFPLFVDQDMVEVWKKDYTKINYETRTLEKKDRTVSYDIIVDSNVEQPNLPEILGCRKGKNGCTEYNYVYRENYLGVIPSKLSNIYFIGFTRPSTSGLANVTEIQSLLVHKMLVDSEFRRNVRSNIFDKMVKYNQTHYVSDDLGRMDHAVYYGFYIREIAQIIGIDFKLKNCRNINDYWKYLRYPNTTAKFRQHGEYKVNGCAQFVESIDKYHQRWSGLSNILRTYVTYHILILTASVQLYVQSEVSTTGFLGLLVLQYLSNHLLVSLLYFSVTPYYLERPYSDLRYTYLFIGWLCILWGGPIYLILVFGLEIIMSTLVRYFAPERNRHLFNDMRVKRRYKWFLEKYLRVYRAVTEK